MVREVAAEVEVTTETPDVGLILRQWEEEHQSSNYDPIPLLTRLAEMIETETENYIKMDPDPFDERHPSRVDPSCALGHMLKVLFRKDSFMNKLVNDYLRDNYYARLGVINKDVRKLNVSACRLMLDIMPGLETSAVFETPSNDALVHRLFAWADKSSEPLQTYATGLLAAAMEVQDIAAGFREHNGKLVPLMLERLHCLQTQAHEDRHGTQSVLTNRPFAHLSFDYDEDESTPRRKARGRRKAHSALTNHRSPPACDDSVIPSDFAESQRKTNGVIRRDSESEICEKSKRKKEMGGDSGLMSPPLSRPSPFHASDCSNSSWAEMETFVIGNVQMYPPTLATRTMFILRYLTPMGEYQEFLSHVFEKNALELILQLINLRESKNSRLAFEALKYLASLLCHKKFSIEFINMNGLQALLEVPRPSIAATGVSICLYYLAYCEDAMERVCFLPQPILSDLVSYSLWLLECSHDSGRCHATMFFGLSFQFRVILEEFDTQDGLRKLYNVLSTLPILVPDDVELSEDTECSARQIVRHVCVALKRYLEAHLYIRAEQLRRHHISESNSESHKLHPAIPSYKACKISSEEVEDAISTLLELMPFRGQWPPVDELMRLGGVTLLLQVIAFAYEWNYSGRAETVRSALDVLRICCVMPKVQLHLCERVDLPDEAMTVGLNVILGAAEGEIVVDPDVQRAALGILITCLCAPTQRVGGSVARYSSSGSTKKRTQNVKSSEEVIEKMWDCVRSNNGIMVLLTLMMIKTPITDADSIRCLACHALTGLARSETVRQIISKLPLFTHSQLQTLMRDPILQDRRTEHVAFQKYAFELLERVSGKSKPNGNELEVSLANIHRASVIAQTRIQFNDRQLFQLIQQHLSAHGMKESAQVLQKEAGLPAIKPATPSVFLSPFSYKAPLTNSRGRSSGSPGGLLHRFSCNTSSTALSSFYSDPVSISSNTRIDPPIRLNLTNNRKTELRFTPPSTCRSLQKPILYDPSQTLTQPPLLRENHVTLDFIITEYLTNQHALCKNPMVTCPQFNLFVPHKCPDPKAKNRAPANFVMRLMRGPRSARLDQRLVHSRFCPVRTLRLGDNDAFFTCCEFVPPDKHLIVGTHHGEVKVFDLNIGSEIATFQCHESYIANMQANRDGSLLLTSSTWRRPLSALWKVNNIIEMKFPLQEEDYVEFSKSQDRIIGTKQDIATIYDVETTKVISVLTPTVSNQYTKNRATFSPTDELVLSDGVLWDINSGKEIHKLDKLNQALSGVFHPNGLEVVSNTEVWDLRTFHLLRTVLALNQSEVVFSPTGSAIYSVSLEQEMEEDTTFETSFKTLDAYDYSSIATIDVKKNIYDLACNQQGTNIAIVENQGVFESVQESSVRLYDIGRRRNDEDEGEEEEEEEEDMDGSEDGSGSQSSDQQGDNSLTLEGLLAEEILDVSENNDEAADDANNDEEADNDDSNDADFDENEMLDSFSDSDSSSEST